MWVASATLMLSTFLSYVDRQVLAVLSPLILQDTGMTAEAYTCAVSAFSILYTIGNPIWGSILDYVGLRTGMFAAVVLRAAATTAHASVGGFAGFASLRAVLGFGEGSAFPGVLRTAMESLPPNRQSRGMALGYSGASLGALVTPLIITPLALRFGWRSAFVFAGALGVIWLALWSFVAKPPFLPVHRRSGLRVQWPNLAERRAWIVMSSFGLGALALGVAAYLSPLYLNRALGLTQAQLGKVLWIPMLGWEAGYFFWGWIADRYAVNDPRPIRFFVLLTILGLPVALMTLTSSWVVAVALFFWSTFIADGFVVFSLRVGSLIYPRDQTGLVAGIGSGSWGAVQALILPVYGRWFDLHWYTATFVSMAALPVIGTLLWLWLTRPREFARAAVS